MGYITAFELTWDDKSKSDEISDRLTALKDGKETYFMYALSPDGSAREGCKWYDHEDDMRDLSLEFPGVVFTLHGEGEESGDLWNKYFLNGKCQEARGIVTYPPFKLGGYWK